MQAVTDDQVRDVSDTEDLRHAINLAMATELQREQRAEDGHLILVSHQTSYSSPPPFRPCCHAFQPEQRRDFHAAGCYTVCASHAEINLVTALVALIPGLYASDFHPSIIIYCSGLDVGSDSVHTSPATYLLFPRICRMKCGNITTP